MSSIQKIIKYLAIAFAMFLTFNIILGIMSGLIFIGGSFSDKDNYDTTEKFKNIGVKDNIKVLDIDVVDTNVFIRTGDTFKIKTSNKNIKFKQKNNTISITEKNIIGFLVVIRANLLYMYQRI